MMRFKSSQTKRCRSEVRWARFLGTAFLLFLLVTTTADAARIKDIAEIGGMRINQLVGYGLVVGLDGTGDGKDAKFTLQSMASMLERMGVSIKPGEVVAENVAAVMVTADLPPFARVGNKIDILVSSLGTAKNLQGGTLLLSPLKATDGNVYAVAQGPVMTGGFSASGAAGGGIQKNFPTVGRVVGGATIERQLPDFFANKSRLSLRLIQPDFTTASRVAQAVNQVLLDQVASTPDAGTIEVIIPQRYRGNQVELLALIENLTITPDKTAKIVINERTGTVIMGEDVRISTVAIAHGNLSIQIKETSQVSQPLPFSEGTTVVTPNSDVVVEEGRQPLFLVREGVSIGEVVRALNAMGVTPRDLMAIFQALKSAGALQAKLEIM